MECAESRASPEGKETDVMVLVFLAEGFEEIEALTPVDILRRAGVDRVMTVAVGTSSATVRGSHGISVTADLSLERDRDGICASFGELEMIVVPGGMPGTVNLASDGLFAKLLDRAFRENVRIAAICAAPSVLAKAGMLRGKSAVCYPSFEEVLRENGASVTGARVVTDGTITTSRGMGTALEFALELARILKGEEVSSGLRASVIAHD